MAEGDWIKRYQAERRHDASLPLVVWAGAWVFVIVVCGMVANCG